MKQGVVTEAERIVAWTRYHQGHLPIPELNGGGMVRTQNALEMKEAEEPKALGSVSLLVMEWLDHFPERL